MEDIKEDKKTTISFNYGEKIKTEVTSEDYVSFNDPKNEIELKQGVKEFTVADITDVSFKCIKDEMIPYADCNYEEKKAGDERQTMKVEDQYAHQERSTACVEKDEYKAEGREHQQELANSQCWEKEDAKRVIYTEECESKHQQHRVHSEDSGIHRRGNLFQYQDYGSELSTSSNSSRHQCFHSNKDQLHSTALCETFPLCHDITSRIYMHTGENQPGREVLPSRLLTNKCEECGKTLSSPAYFSRHKCIHADKKPFQCEECGKAFSTSNYLTKHKRIHSGEQPFQCQECGKAFSQSSNLFKHKRIHAGETSYQCEECGKTFLTSDHLTTHKRVHSGEKPFLCEECGKAFSTSSQLREHKRIHSGEKPFQCRECGKAFSHYSSLKKHGRIHLRKSNEHARNE